MYNQYIIRKCSDTRKPINISAHVKYTCIHDMNEKISHKNYIMWEKNIYVSHSIAICYVMTLIMINLYTIETKWTRKKYIPNTNYKWNIWRTS